MKVKESTFRDTYRRCCVLTGADVVGRVNADEIFEFAPEENIDGLAAYAHIDGNREMVFSIFGGANVSDDKFKIIPGSYKKFVRLSRKICGKSEIKILSPEHAAAFDDKILIVDSQFAADERLEETRMLTAIDSLRHPMYPDDIFIMFVVAGFKPEQVWVRCNRIEENNLIGTLLHETKQNFGCKTGDEITVGIFEQDEEFYARAIPL